MNKLSEYTVARNKTGVSATEMEILGSVNKKKNFQCMYCY